MGEWSRVETLWHVSMINYYYYYQNYMYHLIEHKLMMFSFVFLTGYYCVDYVLWLNVIVHVIVKS